MANKQFVIIGLGRFGLSVAKTLYALGNDVLAIDMNEDLVQEISDNVTHAVQVDATDENALRSLGIRNFDVAIVTIGSNIQASVMVTLLVKELGVKYIIAKGHSDLHAKVLYKIGADRVVLPEKDMGVRVAHNLVSESILDYIELSPDYSIMEIRALDEWQGKNLNELRLRSEYGINVMAIKKGEEINISPSAEDKVESGDIIVAIGSAEELRKLEGMIVKLN
ncbi:potassium channel family protein [Clostridium gasigenes]|uniref:Trk system potassium uptake protein TrkA n=1 Tax=Clostridium gasigenes TaxID=94869 RepID=A0A1H0MSD2_9CLOT|nr:TrkA family potassium uptake protein [Clostridium gasigenes]MBB6621852.1 TrkA family potassium uptake protein [Clostridium gasigenes]MBB6716285.1 TrkA family potassium uptake protein [Clostridium gasigenes]MBU3087312.1 TrkA family potassium uptake protein [Clostridium gasigenes]MBU3102841.1 TrkA family potassium uptake protein [Clostridium gasigenes]MBU3106551.1 TrkA family potassium uptake protein [Clostridium gasigenes]